MRLLPIAVFLPLYVTLAAQSSAPRIQPLPPDVTTGRYTLEPFKEPTLSPGQIELLKLDVRFSAETEKGGGAAFSSWFADAATLLNNGQRPVLGAAAIRSAASWKPGEYQLSWQLRGAQMLPGGESGTTWGHYTAVSHDANGHAQTLEGRYITVWARQNGEWKVMLEASSGDVPTGAGDTAPPQP